MLEGSVQHTVASDGLTLAVRDFLDRVGIPHLVHEPDSEVGREILDRLGGDAPPSYPVLERYGDAPFSATSVHDVAISIYGRPDEIDANRAQQQLDKGQSNVLLQLTAEQTYLQASIQVVQAQAARLADTAA